MWWLATRDYQDVGPAPTKSRVPTPRRPLPTASLPEMRPSFHIVPYDSSLLPRSNFSDIVDSIMKTAIHPTYYPDAKVICACGNSFTIGATAEELQVELCSNCHPFFTGKQKLVDTARRVDKFQKRADAKTATPARSKRTKLAAKSAKRQLKVDESNKRASKKSA